jgi:putative nucleotidyltransferase with HDIG domain
MQAVIQVMESTIGARDPYTVVHQQQATHIATAIAEDMGLSPASLETVHVAGRLHDLGKIAMPIEILFKSGKLTDLEFAIIKTHPQVGYDILKPLNFPREITQTIIQHHERMDGSGYPQGLVGQEIMLEAKILGVADVLESMCCHRPYRPALGIEKAMEEITKNRGILYDPAVVDSCLRLYQESSRPEQRLFPNPQSLRAGDPLLAPGLGERVIAESCSQKKILSGLEAKATELERVTTEIEHCFASPATGTPEARGSFPAHDRGPLGLPWAVSMAPKQQKTRKLQEVNSMTMDFFSENLDLAEDQDKVQMVLFCLKNYVSIDPDFAGLSFRDKLEEAGQMARSFLNQSVAKAV